MKIVGISETLISTSNQKGMRMIYAEHSHEVLKTMPAMPKFTKRLWTIPVSADEQLMQIEYYRVWRNRKSQAW